MPWCLGSDKTLTSDLVPEPHALVFGVGVEGQTYPLTSVYHCLGHVAALGHRSTPVGLYSHPVLARTGDLEQEECRGHLKVGELGGHLADAPLVRGVGLWEVGAGDVGRTGRCVFRVATHVREFSPCTTDGVASSLSEMVCSAKLADNEAIL